MKKVKKPKPKPLSYYKKKVWDLCREIAFRIYPHRCYTCDVTLEKGSPNMQLGHFIPSSVCGAFLRYDLRNLRWQCMRCNIHAGGNGAEYHRRMVKEKGQKHVDQIFRDKQVTIKADSLFYIGLIHEYKDMLETLCKQQ